MKTVAVTELRLVMTAEDWAARARPEVAIEGLEVCRHEFGASA